MKLESRMALLVAKYIPRGYWRITRFAAMRDQTLWDYPIPLKFIPGATIRSDLREPVFMEFLRNGCFGYQAGEDILFKSILRPGDLVFDVGANIGYPTILFAHIIGSTGKVIALEPSLRAFRLLKRTTSDFDNIESINVAVSNKKEEVLFYETGDLVRSSIEAVPGVQPYTVTTVTLDKIADRTGVPVFVKIDVEGHEACVIKGMSSILNEKRPPILMFEALTNECLQLSLSTLANIGISSRYSVFRVKQNGTVVSY
ncbi:MAG: FkbM family methyltransferase, partial [Syntrophobacteraceae bacterium]